MPLLELQKRFTEILRIRLGDKSEKGAPRKLSQFRLTSSSPAVLASAAKVYGGDVRAWKNAPHEGPQFELYTETDTMAVVIPPGTNFSQWAEMWSAGGCVRRCDLVTEHLLDTPCLCPTDAEERREAAKKGHACKLTTRCSVFLADLEEVGLARFESHGFYAASELGALYELLELANAGNRFIDAWLRIDHRTGKSEGRTQRYVVPVLELRTGIPALAAAAAGMPALAPAPAELPAPTPPALPAAPPAAAPRKRAPASTKAPASIREAVAPATKEAVSPPAPEGGDAVYVLTSTVKRGDRIDKVPSAFLRAITESGRDPSVDEADFAAALVELERRGGL